MELEKLPSVIAGNLFDKNGFVETERGLMVPAYIGSQLGFNESGKESLEIFYEKLKDIKVLPLCPFKACGEYLELERLDDDMTSKELTEFWQNFNSIVGPVNYETLMPKAKFMIALLDGGHALDDGVSAEIAYFAVKHGPVFGIRTDPRLAENISAPINPAVRYFLDTGPYKGVFLEGPKAYDNALEYIQGFAQGKLDSAIK